MPNGIRDRVWNIQELLRFWQDLTPQCISIRHKKERVGAWHGSLEMIVALFRKKGS